MRPKKERGQALLLTAAALVVLIGFVGLGVDMGVARYEKRLQQTAADAAAIAGATNLSPYTGVQTGAQNASAANGFTDNTGGGACAAPPTNLAEGQVTVTVCNGPSAGPHTGNANYVEVFVSAGQPTYFMRILGVNVETITARAVATNFSGATNGSSNYNCLITLGTPASSIEGVNINGHATLNAPTCGIADNGNYNTKGNALTVSAGSFGVSGSGNISGPGGTVTCSSGQSSCPQYSTPAVANPLASLPPPCSPCAGGTSLSTNANMTINPGTYSSISIGPANVVFNPGIYIINGPGGLSIGANATVSGSGVMFYFTNGATVNMVGTPGIQLTAPSTGPYAGILFYQDPADTAGPSLGGNTGSSYNGILYFPSANLTFFGNSTSVSVGIVITDALTMSGNPTVNLQGQAGVPGGLPPALTAGSAILVE